MPTITHHQSGTRLYNIWFGIKDRCFNSRHLGYRYYGSRGITVCAEWLDFPVFAAWAMANGYGDDLTIERIDNNGNYCPENCAWIPRAMQSKNKRDVVPITYKGETRNLKEWANALGISYLLLYKRIRSRHWSIERAFESKPMVNRWKYKS